jgi:hypothetical protein
MEAEPDGAGAARLLRPVADQGVQFGQLLLGLTTAAIMCGDLGIRLGLRATEGTMTAWMSIPAAG